MKLPDSKTEEEELKFWKKHSISNYWEYLKESDDIFKRPKLKPVTIKFDPSVIPLKRSSFHSHPLAATLFESVVSKRY